jgi:hypothetical protein
VHDVADVHDTPDNMLKWPLDGLGLGWIVHVVPFQRSTSGPPPAVEL